MEGSPEPGRGRQPTPGWVPALLALLTVVWVLGTPVLALGALLGTWHLDGEPATAAEHAAAQRHALLATVLAAGCPGAAGWLALRWRRPVAGVVFGIGAVLGLVGGLLLTGLVRPDVRDAPVRDHGPPVCQERSGGDSDCPGG